jgi:hypothetical protein
MLLVGLLSTQGFLETSFYIKAHILLKYGIYFLWLMLIALIGHWGWKDFPQLWVKNIWLLAYSFAIVLLLLLGFIDLFWGPIPLYYKKDISHFRSFFLSPALFVLLYFLSVFTKNKEDV